MLKVEEKAGLLEVPEIPAKYKGRIRIGTLSWTYDSWKGLIYQPEKKYETAEYLIDYSKYYNTVELD